MKYPWLLRPFPYKWEDASKPGSPTGFMTGGSRKERWSFLFMWCKGMSHCQSCSL